jgi:hypothetical protein
MASDVSRQPVQVGSVSALDALDFESGYTGMDGTEPPCALIREVEFAAADVWAAVLHGHNETCSRFRIGEPQLRSKGERLVCDDVRIVHIVPLAVCHRASVKAWTIPRSDRVPFVRWLTRGRLLCRRVLLFGLNALFVVIEHIEAKKHDCNGYKKSTDQLFLLFLWDVLYNT